jgi:hypothetical protein
MKFYLIRTPEKKLEIIKVPHERNADFIEAYGHLVLCSGDNLMQVILSLQTWAAIQNEDDTDEWPPQRA